MVEEIAHGKISQASTEELNEALDMIKIHGRKAAQHLVDLMQAAIRAGKDDEAMRLNRILQLVLLNGPQ